MRANDPVYNNTRKWSRSKSKGNNAGSGFSQFTFKCKIYFIRLNYLFETLSLLLLITSTHTVATVAQEANETNLNAHVCHMTDMWT